MTGVKTKHPSYFSAWQKWVVCRDNYEGQDAIKSRASFEYSSDSSGYLPMIPGVFPGKNLTAGQAYLPPTNGMIADGIHQGKLGYRNYQSYLDRALHSPFFTEAVDMMLGLLWNKEPSIELGPLEDMFGNGKGITRKKESIKELMMRVNTEQLQTGRLGLLADLPSGPQTDPRPYIALYKAESIINWDVGARNEIARDSLNLVVLDESENVRDTFEWKWVDKYRVLWLGDLEDNEDNAQYYYGLVEIGETEEVPKFSSIDFQRLEVFGQPIDYIPFQIINTKDLSAEVGLPPLLGLAYSVIALYRLDADYRQALHILCQDTLVTSGADEDSVSAIGAGAHIRMTNPLAKAYFIGIDSSGLPEMREAMQSDLRQCAKKAGELLADNSRARESGDALEQRIGTKSASLTQIATTCAEGVQNILRMIAKWLGHPDSEIEKIIIKPNLEFTNKAFDPQDLKALVESKMLGGPLTLKSIHEWNVRRGYTNLTWDELLSETQEESAFKALFPSIEEVKLQSQEKMAEEDRKQQKTQAGPAGEK